MNNIISSISQHPPTGQVHPQTMGQIPGQQQPYAQPAHAVDPKMSILMRIIQSLQGCFVNRVHTRHH